jgi:hypothetical protein
MFPWYSWFSPDFPDTSKRVDNMNLQRGDYEDKKFQSYINSKSISELADDLSEKLKQYKTETLKPETTQSIPNLDLMCEMADVIALGLKD